MVCTSAVLSIREIFLYDITIKNKVVFNMTKLEDSKNSKQKSQKSPEDYEKELKEKQEKLDELKKENEILRKFNEFIEEND